VTTGPTAVNPFDVSPPCEGFVPGWGDVEADFHLIRGRPTGRGHAEHGFVELPLGTVLESVGLLRNGHPSNLYASFVHACPDATVPTHLLESIFDAELRAVTAHVLIPVGKAATAFVLGQYTNRDPRGSSLAALHAREIASGAWIVLPLREPAEWSADDTSAAREALDAILARDYRREADLGRHLTGGDQYLVR
jgi:hypothetical protein